MPRQGSGRGPGLPRSASGLQARHNVITAFNPITQVAAGAGRSADCSVGVAAAAALARWLCSALEGGLRCGAGGRTMIRQCNVHASPPASHPPSTAALGAGAAARSG